jgi:hypothetical protein
MASLMPHEYNQRAFTKPSVIWQRGDEYKRIGGYRTKYWLCGLCARTTVLTMTDNSTTGLRHLKKNIESMEMGNE